MWRLGNHLYRFTGFISSSISISILLSYNKDVVTSICSKAEKIAAILQGKKRKNLDLNL